MQLLILRGRVNHLTQLLCSTCSSMEKESNPVLAGELLEWWTAHKKYDEDLAAAKERLKQVGRIDELTPAERSLIYNEDR
jgi:hypothetical protein